MRLLAMTVTAGLVSLALPAGAVWACSAKELATKVTTVTDLLMAEETGEPARHAGRMKHAHESMLRTSRKTGISYDGLCAGYDQLTRELRDYPGHP